ncbi:MAG: family 1 encapsulin nanocompartment shell protein [Solirubrobacterales bacterium]
MSHLLREHAPVTEAGWELLDSEARERLEPALAARRLVDFSGPHGWQHSATNLGRVEQLGEAPAEGIGAVRRLVLPLTELRADFAVARAELAAADRGAEDADLEALDTAAHQLAIAENAAVFHGWEAAGIVGIAAASPHEAIALGEDCERYPRHVAKAIEALLQAGVGGPYGLALGPGVYARVLETSEHGGYPLLEHLREILSGPIVWAPGVQGAVVLSLRGGDFLFESGEDIAIGYADHDAEAVRLYLEESFSFRVATPEAAVALSNG